MKKSGLLLLFWLWYCVAQAQDRPQHIFQIAEDITQLYQNRTDSSQGSAPAAVYERIDHDLALFFYANGLAGGILSPSDLRKRLDDDNNTILMAALNDYFELDSFRSKFELDSSKEETPIPNAYNNRINALKTLDVTAYADAFARIIIKRFKQDLKETLFSNIYAEFAKIPDIDRLLPHIMTVLTRMDTDIYNPELYLSQLKTASEMDFLNLFNNANQVLVARYASSSTYDSEQMALSLMLQIADGLVKNQHPAKILDRWTFIKGAQPLDKEAALVRNAVLGLQIASQTLRVYEADTSQYHWITPTTLKQHLLSQDDLSQKITLGLIYEIAYARDTAFAAAIAQFYDTFGSDYYKLKSYLTESAYYLNRIQISIDEIGNIHKQGLDKQPKRQLIEYKLLDLYQNMFELVQTAPKILTLKDSSWQLPQTWYKGVEMAALLPKLYITARTGDFKSTAFNAFSLIKTLTTTQKYVKIKLQGRDTVLALDRAALYDAQKRPLNRFIGQTTDIAYVKIGAEWYSTNIFYNNNTCTEIYKPLKISPKLLQYLSLMGELAEAQTSADIEAVLDKTVLPSGSSRQKETGTILGLNSYVGGLWSPKTGQISLSMPIGLNLSLGKRRTHLAGKTSIWPHTYQFFGSLVDVGAIAGVRFNDNNQPLPKITLDNIFSPGLFITTGGWFNTPINLGMGYQQQPRLEGIDANGQPRLGQAPYQWRLLISWDIPLLYLKKW